MWSHTRATDERRDGLHSIVGDVVGVGFHGKEESDVLVVLLQYCSF